MRRKKKRPQSTKDTTMTSLADLIFLLFCFINAELKVKEISAKLKITINAQTEYLLYRNNSEYKIQN